MAWTEEKITKLRQLWGKGNTASQIAGLIGDVTRNAVIGKAHRLNLSGKIITKNSNFKKKLILNKVKLKYLKKLEEVGLNHY